MKDNIIPVHIENEMASSFIDYSMSVIVSRALPDVRDGFKPVHRRILFAMYGLKNYHSKPYLKSARIVGDVNGKYHPHGEVAVYDSLVRMAQDFSLRYPLVDGQGNFGSVDGDSPAAMRYTESRMQSLTELLLTDIDKDTVDFVPNYDNKDEEPSVLPAEFPQLLVNGASGIAVGMATNIPPHNMSEVIAGLLALIANPEMTIAELMTYIKGPDFPTGAEIHGVKGIREAYLTGKGSVIMRAKASIEEAKGRELVVITEIPYQVNKAKLIEKIADLVREKKIEGISDIRDESKKDIRIVLELKRGENGEVLLNNLYKLTQMQASFGANFVALVDGIPRLLNLKEILIEFYKHRRDVVLRRTSFLLRKAEEKAHILLGLKVAVENADQVIELIRKAEDSEEAGRQLIALYGLSEVQAKAILDMRLARLTGLEREKIVKEHKILLEEIGELRSILNSPEKVTQIIVEELKAVDEKYGDERKTQIIMQESDGFSMESLIENEEVFVTVSHSGYVKRTKLSEISAQKRGGKGKFGMLTKEGDIASDVFVTSNHQSLLCFTDTGKVYNLKVYDLPEAPLRAKGKHFVNLINLAKDERVVSILSVPNFEQENSFVFSVTEKGYIKKTDLSAYAHVRASGIIGLKLDDGDRLVRCFIGVVGDDILLSTKMGKSIRFKEEDVRPMGRASRGVTGIRFTDADDSVVGGDVIKKAEAGTAVLSVCEKGYGKRTPLEEYRLQSRGGKGIYTIKVTDKNGPVVSVLQVRENEELVIMSSEGKITRIKVSEIATIGRLTQGVRLMSIAGNEKVNTVSVFEADEDQETETDLV